MLQIEFGLNHEFGQCPESQRRFCQRDAAKLTKIGIDGRQVRLHLFDHCFERGTRRILSALFPFFIIGSIQLWVAAGEMR